MMNQPKLALGIVWVLVLIAGCGRGPQSTTRVSTPADAAGPPMVKADDAADPCTIALTPHEGTSRADEAIIRLQQASRQSQQPMAYLERLGWAFVAKARSSFDPGFYTLAEQCALCMASKQPDSAEALLLHGHVLNQLHRFREGETLARQLVAQRGLSYDYGLLGDALMEQGKIDDAVAAYDHMLQQKPSPQGYIRAAHVRWLTGDLPGAIQLMRMATNGFRDPEASAWSHVRLTLYELQAGQVQQATNRIAATIDAWPDYAPALAVHGRLLLAEGEPHNAIAPLKRAVALNPLPESQWLLIEALHAVDRTDEAKAVEQTLMQRGVADDRRTLALYLATTGRDPGLAVQLAQAEFKVREDVLTLDALAWALRAAGKYQEARAVNARAMKAGTRDARLFYHAGVIAAAVGEHEEASHWFARATAERQMLLPSERAQLIKAAAAIL
ncbi:tetratricopeptide repeat protein [Candidatus Entotheonella palauensis]|uniref:tetratricopeptide repeat protein n=1 Tax=Candidatus Entotheonella palauensis TaxID=93172 RepID=UPI000B8001A8|nr:tetratricopeptide repeat protein [Candidatus Entotheonella palauensis]